MKISYVEEYQKGHKLLFVFQLLSHGALIVSIIITIGSYGFFMGESFLAYLLIAIGYAFIQLIFSAIKATFIARDIQIETFMEKQVQKRQADKTNTAE